MGEAEAEVNTDLFPHYGTSVRVDETMGFKQFDQALVGLNSIFRQISNGTRTIPHPSHCLVNSIAIPIKGSKFRGTEQGY